MPQLDALRAFAVSAVLVHHLINPGYLPVFISEMPLGYLGVRLFFVLSGFLITGILLQSRIAVEAGKETSLFVARQFYIRRFLRIFPLYYCVIAVALLIGLPEAYADWPWLVTYTYNIHLSLEGWYPEYFAHFWSLAVEEQFYVVWPWLILFAPRRVLLPIVAGVIFLAPLYRLYAITHELNGVAAYVFTLSSLDALGIGSFLALLVAFGRKNIENRVIRWMLPLSLCGLISLELLMTTGNWTAMYYSLFEFFVAMLFGWLVWNAAIGFRGIFGRLLSAGPLVYIGKISYGIYVYHLFMPPLVRRSYEFVGITVDHKGPLEFVGAVAATLAMASLSWRFFEAPLNDLKRFFPYRGQRLGEERSRTRPLPMR